MTPMAGSQITYITQGEFRVSQDPDEVFSTILGSCVAVCLRDPVARVGGMNHFLLPSGHDGERGRSMRYGVHAMEMLINALFKLGAGRDRLEAKLFGGARLSMNLRDVGADNAAFALDYLAAEDINCVASSLGGNSARRVLFHPVTGQAKQMLVPDTSLPPQRVGPAPAGQPDSGEVVLFGQAEAGEADRVGQNTPRYRRRGS